MPSARSPTSLPTTEATWSRLLGVGAEAVDPGGEDRLHGGRHAGVLDRPRQPVGAALALEVAALGQLADDLLDEEGVALRCARGSARRGRPARGPRRPGRAAARACRRAERLQRDRAVGRRAAQAASYSGRKLTTPASACPRPRRSARRASRRWPRRSSAGPRPRATTVLRRSGALTRRQTTPPQRPLARLGAHLRQRAVGVGDAEEVEEQRQVVGEARGRAAARGRRSSRARSAPVSPSPMPK